MEKWENKSVDIGIVNAKSKVEVEFVSTEPLKIIDIKPGCPKCTKVLGYNKNSKKLKVIYSVGPFPMHLKHAGVKQTNVTKVLYITYADETQETLYFTGKMVSDNK